MLNNEKALNNAKKSLLNDFANLALWSIDLGDVCPVFKINDVLNEIDYYLCDHENKASLEPYSLLDELKQEELNDGKIESKGLEDLDMNKYYALKYELADDLYAKAHGIIEYLFKVRNIKQIADLMDSVISILEYIWKID